MDQSSGPKYSLGQVSRPKYKVKVMCHVMSNHLKIVTVILTIIRARLPHTGLYMVDLHYIPALVYEYARRRALCTMTHCGVRDVYDYVEPVYVPFTDLAYVTRLVYSDALRCT